MKVPEAIVEVLKREGVEFIMGYPVNPVIEAAAAAGIRPIIVRQERTGIHMADAVSRMTSGERVGVFAMQHGPGTENAFGGVAQAFSESVPLVVIPGGYARHLTDVFPNFNASLNFRNVTKWCEQVTVAKATVEAMRRAFTQARNGRPGPALVEFPADVWLEDFPEPFDYEPTGRLLTAPDLQAVDEVAAALVAAERPVIYAGQGVHYARAWDELRDLAELLEAPVTSSLEGKSAFPENHPLSLGSGGRSLPGPVYQHIREADVIFGIGCSFSRTSFGIQMPSGPTYIHATVDPTDINKDLPARYALIGDAKLTLQALYDAVYDRLGGKPRGRAEHVVPRIEGQREEWLQRWLPRLTYDRSPLSPYRVIWDLMHCVDLGSTIITHDAGSPRDQLSPFWPSLAPQSYIGWGKTTQLGYSLGLAMGAKLASPDKLCINVWGDAAIGMTGLDFETAVRERIPILSVLFNNFSMAMEIPVMPQATERFHATDISGNYADLARSLGGYGERVTEPGEIVPAIQRGIAQTQNGTPALLEFITEKEIEYSYFR